MDAMQIGQRAQFTNGAKGVIQAVYNGGAMLLFVADSGARFTVRADEVAAEGTTPQTRHVECGAVCRTVVMFERDNHQASRTPRQRTQAASPEPRAS